MIKFRYDARLVPLFLTIFFDAIGWGVVFPVLTPLIIDNATHLFSATTSIAARNFWYEFAIAIYCVFMFLGAPVLGSLSDRYGRKKILLLALSGCAVGFFVAGYGVIENSFGLIILGRIIAGITAANLPIAQAAIVDISTDKNKVSRLGLIMFANGTGFALGPTLGGFLINPKIFSQISYQIPFFVTAFLAFICVGLVQWLFRETFEGNKNQSISVFIGIRNIVEAFIHKNIRHFSLGLLLFMLGYVIFFTTIPVFLTERFHESGVSIGYFITYFATIFAVALIVLLPKVTARFSIIKIVSTSLAVQFISYAIFTMTHNIVGLFFIAGVIAITVAFSYVGFVTLLSDHTDKEHQGKIMGVVGSVIALTWGVGPLISGGMEELLFLAPYFASLGFLFVSMRLVWYKNQKN